MRMTVFLTAAALAAAGTLGSQPALAQQPGITRTDLSRSDLSVPGLEALQVLVEFGEGVLAERHAHPGEEIVYVVEGLLEYRLDGKPPVTLKPGDVLFIPRGAIHAARNVGPGKGAELATYIVDKGEPLLMPAE